MAKKRRVIPTEPTETYPDMGISFVPAVLRLEEYDELVPNPLKFKEPNEMLSKEGFRMLESFRKSLANIDVSIAAIAHTSVKHGFPAASVEVTHKRIVDIADRLELFLDGYMSENPLPAEPAAEPSIREGEHEAPPVDNDSADSDGLDSPIPYVPVDVDHVDAVEPSER